LSATRVPPIMILVFTMVGLGLLDNFLAEEPFVPDQLKTVGFYVLAPSIVLGTIGLLPYLKQRLAIVRPKQTANLIFAISIATSAFLIVSWGVVYYQLRFLGPSSISGTALVMKDVLLVGSVAMFAAIGVRIYRWFEKTKNKVVLSWSLMFLLTIPFAFVRILPDYFPNLDATTVSNMFNLSRLISYGSTLPPIYMMGFPYYGWKWVKWIGASMVGDVMVVSLSVLTILNFPLDNLVLTILISGLYYSTIIFIVIYSRLVRAVPNRAAKDYYWGMGYGIGLFGAMVCAIDAGIPLAYPLPWFAALSLSVPAACLCFATFTSGAAYYSISEEVKREIRSDKGFLSAIGEAESQISTEQEVTRFYDRFTGLARESGAVEAGSLTKDEIHAYASAIKRMQKPSTDPSQ
jgi:hypothetical protein